MAIPELEDADAYHALRGNVTWTDLGSDDQGEADKTAALYRARDYIRAYYEFDDDVYFEDDEEDDDPLITEANILLALEMTEPVSMRQDAAVSRVREKLDGLLEEETVYANVPSDPYPQVSSLLRPVLKRNSRSSITTIKLVR
jgi:hypothetical protein